MKTSIAIFVKGGVVQEVRSTSKDIKIDLVDYDNLEVEGKDSYDKDKIEAEAIKKHPYVIF